MTERGDLPEIGLFCSLEADRGDGVSTLRLAFRDEDLDDILMVQGAPLI